MRLPRDVGGEELASLLGKYGYHFTRQTGSYLRPTSSLKGTEHHITIPRRKPLKIGTLSSIMKEVATYVERDRQQLIEELFGGQSCLEENRLLSTLSAPVSGKAPSVKAALLPDVGLPLLFATSVCRQPAFSACSTRAWGSSLGHYPSRSSMIRLYGGIVL